MSRAPSCRLLLQEGSSCEARTWALHLILQAFLAENTEQTNASIVFKRRQILLRGWMDDDDDDVRTCGGDCMWDETNTVCKHKGVWCGEHWASSCDTCVVSGPDFNHKHCNGHCAWVPRDAAQPGDMTPFSSNSEQIVCRPKESESPTIETQDEPLDMQGGTAEVVPGDDAVAAHEGPEVDSPDGTEEPRSAFSTAAAASVVPLRLAAADPAVARMSGNTMPTGSGDATRDDAGRGDQVREIMQASVTLPHAPMVETISMAVGASLGFKPPPDYYSEEETTKRMRRVFLTAAGLTIGSFGLVGGLYYLLHAYCGPRVKGGCRRPSPGPAVSAGVETAVKAETAATAEIAEAASSDVAALAWAEAAPEEAGAASSEEPTTQAAMCSAAG